MKNNLVAFLGILIVYIMIPDPMPVVLDLAVSLGGTLILGMINAARNEEA